MGFLYVTSVELNIVIDKEVEIGVAELEEQHVYTCKQAELSIELHATCLARW